jgi:hypothetical protein
MSFLARDLVQCAIKHHGYHLFTITKDGKSTGDVFVISCEESTVEIENCMKQNPSNTIKIVQCKNQDFINHFEYCDRVDILMNRDITPALVCRDYLTLIESN